jgi:hypothetical protein
MGVLAALGVVVVCVIGANVAAFAVRRRRRGRWAIRKRWSHRPVRIVQEKVGRGEFRVNVTLSGPDEPLTDADTPFWRAVAIGVLIVGGVVVTMAVLGR